MTPESQQLAQKLTGHPQFRWLGGCRRVDAATGCAWRRVVNRWTPEHRGGVSDEVFARSVADLDDFATVGTVIGQVREICPQARLFPPENPGESWVINDGIMDHLAEGATRGEVWAQASLEVVR